MIECLTGACLLFIPFCLVLCFKKKRFGVACVFIGVVLFHLCLALALQAAGIFSYASVVVCNAVASAIAVAVCVRFHAGFHANHGAISKQFPKINWFVLAAFAIVFYELFSVHYFYTGIIVTDNGEHAVVHASYQYPYFSDEYSGVALTAYSIRNHSLPLADPLHGDTPSADFLVCFFSVTAELFLLLGVSPLAGYVPFAIVSGLTLCFLAYLFLRSRNVDSFSASCAVLALPFIVNAGNLPGIWSLLPFIGGLIVFMDALVILSECEVKSGESKSNLLCFAGFFVSCAVSVALYPPIIVFVVPVLLCMFVGFRLSRNRRMFLAIAGLLAVIAVGICVVLALTGTLSLAFSFSMRNNLVGGIPSFPIWIVVPWFVLPFAALGVWGCLKNKMYPFVSAIAVGMAYWIAYAYTTEVLIIDYPRIVVVTSFLTVLLAGFGLGFLVKKIPPAASARWMIPLQIAVCLVFAVMAISYPLESWAKFVLRSQTPEGLVVTAPAPPVDDYLTGEDLRLFSGIESQRFISSPWKGLVIGAATHNYPLDSKASTLTESLYSYRNFISLDCEGKSAVASMFFLGYAYTPTFSCPDFIFIGSSSEGLYLYKFAGYNEATNTNI